MIALPPALSLTGVDLTEGDTEVLRGIDWVVRPDERWVIVGPNGSGKTSLLRLASFQRGPTHGTVTVLGDTYGCADIRVARRRIGFGSTALLQRLRPALSAHDAVLTGKEAALETWWHSYTEADHRPRRRPPRPGRVRRAPRPGHRVPVGRRAQADPRGARADGRPRAPPVRRALRRPRPRRPRVARRAAGRPGRRARRPAPRDGHAPPRGDPPRGHPRARPARRTHRRVGRDRGRPDLRDRLGRVRPRRRRRGRGRPVVGAGQRGR